MDLIEFIYLFFLNKNLIGINSGNETLIFEGNKL